MAVSQFVMDLGKGLLGIGKLARCRRDLLKLCDRILGLATLPLLHTQQVFHPTAGACQCSPDTIQVPLQFFGCLVTTLAILAQRLLQE